MAPPRVVNIKDEPQHEQPPRVHEIPELAKTKLSPADKKLQIAISGGYQMVGGGMMAIGLRLGDDGLAGSGLHTINTADTIADAWLDVANKNPKVKAYLKKLTEATSLGVLVGCHVAIALPLLASRGIIPEDVAAMMMATTAQDNGTPANN